MIDPDFKGSTKNRSWCPGAELNHRHRDFQSRALPTELPGRAARIRDEQGCCPDRQGPSVVGVRLGGDGIFAPKPSIQVDLPAAEAAKRVVFRNGRPPAYGAAFPQGGWILSSRRRDVPVHVIFLRGCHLRGIPSPRSTISASVSGSPTTFSNDPLSLRTKIAARPWMA